MRVLWFGPVLMAAAAWAGCAQPDSDDARQEAPRTAAARRRPGDEQTSAIGVRQIGRSAAGRPIQSLTIGEGRTTVVIIGGLHTGNEHETVDLVRNLAEAYSSGERRAPPGVKLVFVPNANPDGYASGERTNANGVDLNRNWPSQDWAEHALHGDAEVYGGPSPLSEPETAALYDYVIGIRPDLVLSFHGYAGVVHHNGEGDAADLGEAFAEAAEYDLIDEWEFYPITGELIEAFGEAGFAAADVELAEGDDASLDRAADGLERVLEELT